MSPFDFVEGSKTCEYVSRDKIEGDVGQTYTLEVVYEGVNYTASDVMPYTDDGVEFPIIEVSVYSHNQEYMDISATKHNFGFNSFMIYNFCRYSHDSLNSKSYNIYKLLKNRTYNHKGSIPQGVFPNVWTYYFTIYVHKSDTVYIIKGAISEAYYSHLIARFNETDWHSGLFSTGPGSVKTNLSEGGIGFFYAMNIKRKLVTMEELADGYEQTTEGKE